VGENKKKPQTYAFEKHWKRPRGQTKQTANSKKNPVEGGFGGETDRTKGGQKNPEQGGGKKNTTGGALLIKAYQYVFKE